MCIVLYIVESGLLSIFCQKQGHNKIIVLNSVYVIYDLFLCREHVHLLKY